MADTTSLKSQKSTTSSKPRTPGVEGVTKKVGFARPTLIIPPPQTQYVPQYAPYTPGGMSTHSHHSYHSHGPPAYGRKASMFMMHQFEGMKGFAKSGLGIGEKCSYWCYGKIRLLSRKWFTHCFLSIILTLYTVGGAVLFMYVEGEYEDGLVEGDLRRNRYQLIRQLRNLSINMPEKTSDGEWEGAAVKLIDDYETTFIKQYEISKLIIVNKGHKIWTLWNSIVFCATVYTTLGYGHIYPSTTAGRALTMVYALVGIPLFLIALTDFGKLFTRGIKFLWSFVRRLYYTGSCRKARKRATASDIFRGAQLVYGIATFRRPSNVSMSEGSDNLKEPYYYKDPTDALREQASRDTITTAVSEETPTTPDLSTFEIDDEFNLPISVALFILVSYMFVGALVYCALEKWEFFTAFYFVFISLTTVGFGDFIPEQPIVLLISIVYLVFGLALMSMCINVVQLKLSDTFQQASIKISSTMGFEVDGEPEDPEIGTSEIAQVHSDKDIEVKNEPDNNNQDDQKSTNLLKPPDPDVKKNETPVTRKPSS